MFAWLKRVVGGLYFWLLGWKVVGCAPPTERFVLIAAPHTSSWDLPHMLASSWVLGVDVSWMGKKSLFRAPFGWLMRALGGIPIDRSARHDVVRQIADVFGERQHLILAVSAEGSRRKVEVWKSGFYHIARTAGVPIGLGFLDYGAKRGGLGPLMTPTGDLRADMDVIRAFYAGMTGKHVDRFATPRLRNEELTADELQQPPPLAPFDEPGAAESAAPEPEPVVG